MNETDGTMLDWIVCLGAERSVAGLHVACPAWRGTDGPRTVGLTDCLACRHLVATGVDRMAAAMCSVEAQVELEGGF
jgi:hypothetical protein